MLTWIYDDIGCALSAILDDSCIRNLALSNTVGWVFGLSVFSLKGEHIGWFEEGVLFDIHNNVLGFIPGAAHRCLEAPALEGRTGAAGLQKRPQVPNLRGRIARPAGRAWSAFCLSSYLDLADLPPSRSLHVPGAGPGTERCC
ncbi:hypothetical protein LP419_01475 [Massilia sp. H-1]|nr:hypothetical protein LP419_01475 [Massilia sp. H-1]